MEIICFKTIKSMNENENRGAIGGNSGQNVRHIRPYSIVQNTNKVAVFAI